MVMVALLQTTSKWLEPLLQGSKGASNGATAERLDVNQNGIIDENDVTVIRGIVLNTIDSSTVTSVNTTDLPSHSAKSYREYNAQTGTQIGTQYTISDVGDISTTSSRVIIGDDDREKDYSKSGVVKLTSNVVLDGVTYTSTSTGFVVGEHTILTSAHCVFDTSTDAKVTSLKYTLYNSNGTVNSTNNAVSYHVPVEYINLSSYSATYDYALIEVSDDLSSYVNFDLGVARKYITTTNPTIYVTGYSGEDITANTLLNQMVTGYGYLTSTKIDDNVIYYTTDTVKSESGGPVYVVNSDGSMTVIGINSGQNSTYNLSKRIDTNVLNFIYNNDRVN